MRSRLPVRRPASEENADRGFQLGTRSNHSASAMPSKHRLARGGTPLANHTQTQTSFHVLRSD
jgi:hypothetical protein